jgi:hypothetical protein
MEINPNEIKEKEEIIQNENYTIKNALTKEEFHLKKNQFIL